MKLLCFQARRFWWKAFNEASPEGSRQREEGEVLDAVVVFVQAEKRDEDAERRASVIRQTVKHVKWLMSKRRLGRVVFHSFTHLGGESGSAQFAADFIEETAVRLRRSGYEVWLTPFGRSCEWDLSVYGDGSAKVWKEI